MDASIHTHKLKLSYTMDAWTQMCIYTVSILPSTVIYCLLLLTHASLDEIVTTPHGRMDATLIGIWARGPSGSVSGPLDTPRSDPQMPGYLDTSPFLYLPSTVWSSFTLQGVELISSTPWIPGYGFYDGSPVS